MGSGSSSKKTGSGSRPRPPCTVCGRVHSSSKSEQECRAAAHSSKNRDKSSSKKTSHKSSHRHHSQSRSQRTTHTPTATPTGTGTGRSGSRTATGTATGSGSGSRAHHHHHHHHNHDPESGRHPSSSIGPGLGDPVLIALLVILAISCIVLFVLGIWLLAARNGWPAGLNLSGNIHWTRFISYGTACLILGILFIPLIIFAVLAAQTKRGSTARTNRLLAVFIASVCFIILILMTFNAIFFAKNGPEFITTIIREGWINTVEDDNTVLDACRVQQRYTCEGWEDNSCRGCRPTIDGRFGACTNEQKSLCPRCWVDESTPVNRRADVFQKANAISQLDRGGFLKVSTRTDRPGCSRFVLRRYRTFFIPMSVYTIFLALILILLSWKTCIDSTGRR